MTYGNLAKPYPETIEALQARLREAEQRIDGLVRVKAHQAERITALEAEEKRGRENLLNVIDVQAADIRRLMEALKQQKDWRFAFRNDPHDLPPTLAEPERDVKLGVLLERITALEAEVEFFKRSASVPWKPRWERCTVQHDLPPTRAEEANLSPTWLEAERDVDENEDRNR